MTATERARDIGNFRMHVADDDRSSSASTTDLAHIHVAYGDICMAGGKTAAAIEAYERARELRGELLVDAALGLRCVLRRLSR